VRQLRAGSVFHVHPTRTPADQSGQGSNRALERLRDALRLVDKRRKSFEKATITKVAALIM
jgi:hypothetical protein